MTELTVNVEKTIHVSIEKAFDAWLDPEMLSRFMTPMPGMPESEVENDARVGGSFTIIMHAGGQKLISLDSGTLTDCRASESGLK